VTVSPWLEGLRRRLVRPRTDHRRKARSRTTARKAEYLEQRTLLTVVTLFDEGNLEILADAGESIVVQEDPNTSGFVQVLANGTPLLSLPLLQTSQVTSLSIITGVSNDVVDLSGVDSTAFSALLEINVDTGQGDDTVIASADIGTSILAGDGHDTIIGGTGNDTLRGEDGNDEISGGDGADQIHGGDGEDSIDGDAGNDTVRAGDGLDTVVGGDGDDSINGDDGIDSLFGEAGNDTVIGAQGNDLISGGDGDDSLLGGSNNDSINGDAGNDAIRGNGGDDTLDGGDGDDYILGDGGKDRLQGNLGSDTLIGGSRRDTVEGGPGSDRLLGGGGNDTLVDESISVLGSQVMTVSDDTILGNSGDDTILSLAGADFINAGTGDDLVDTIANVFITVNNVEVAEPDTGAVNLVFTVSLSETVPVQVAVDFQTTAVTATDGADYVGQSGQLIFLPGQATATVSVPILGDFFAESDEIFTLDLSNPVNASLIDNQGEGRILDNDPLQIDVFLLFDDTGSFAFASPTLSTAFPQLISTLQTNFPTASFGFGVGRFEDYPIASSSEDVPYILNQPIISDSEPGFLTAINSALNRSSPGFGGTGPESAIEGLFQVATGAGFDGNGDGDTIDNGPAGPITTQVNMGTTGDVPAYSTFIPDPAGPVLAPTHPVSMASDGVSFRPGSQKFILLATDAPFTVEPDSIDPYVGVNGVTVAASQINNGADPISPGGRGATVQQTIDELVARGIKVIGLGDPGFFGPTSIPQGPLEGLATLTGATNTTGASVENGITPGPSADDIQPGDPLYFQINPNDPQGLADSIATAITAGANLTPPPPPPPPATPPILGNVDDTIFGGPGDDTIRAASSNDLIVGNSGDDLIEAGGGNDTVYGGSGHDTINGSIGDDRLYGQGGNDVLNGGLGDDTLGWDGEGQGQDALFGDDGFNTVEVVGDDSDNSFVVAQNAMGDLTVTDGPAVLTVDRSFRSIVVSGGGGDDTITVLAVNRAGLTAISLDGNGGNDLVDASAAIVGNVKLRLNGDAGEDTLIGSAFDDRIDGGDGDDSLIGNDGDDSMLGGDGADTADGGAGNDTLNGGENNDSLSGGSGDDSIFGGLDNDTLMGDDGNDTLLGQFGDDLLVGGADADSLEGSSGTDTLHGGGGHDFLDGGRNNDVIRGQAGDDTILGDHGDDVIDGDDGNDEILGGDGDDTIMGGDGNDGIAGGDGNDILKGELGQDTIVGGDGDDLLVGGGSSDILLGQQGIDDLNGNSGNDIGSTGEGEDPTPRRIELIDETFVLTPAMLANLDGL
jgi:Ca2+-binding RTX toxin-like protein